MLDNESNGGHFVHSATVTARLTQWLSSTNTEVLSRPGFAIASISLFSIPVDYFCSLNLKRGLGCKCTDTPALSNCLLLRPSSLPPFSLSTSRLPNPSTSPSPSAFVWLGLGLVGSAHVHNADSLLRLCAGHSQSLLLLIRRPSPPLPVDTGAIALPNRHGFSEPFKSG